VGSSVQVWLEPFFGHLTAPRPYKYPSSHGEFFFSSYIRTIVNQGWQQIHSAAHPNGEIQDDGDGYNARVCQPTGCIDIRASLPSNIRIRSNAHPGCITIAAFKRMPCWPDMDTCSDDSGLSAHCSVRYHLSRRKRKRGLIPFDAQGEGRAIVKSLFFGASSRPFARALPSARRCCSSCVPAASISQRTPLSGPVFSAFHLESSAGRKGCWGRRLRQRANLVTHREEAV
jgi:hypothetical protein